MRICTVCKQEKPEDAFPWRDKAHTKRAPRCRDCERAYLAEYRVKNREALSDKGRAYYTENRTRIMTHVRDYYTSDDGQKTRKAHYQKNQARLLAGTKARALQVKLETLAAYGGARCICCGESNIGFLSIDHINGRTKEDRQTGSGRRIYYWLRKHGYPPGYRVMCFNCNCGRRVNGGQCPHETRGQLPKHPVSQHSLVEA